MKYLWTILCVCVHAPPPPVECSNDGNAASAIGASPEFTPPKKESAASAANAANAASASAGSDGRSRGVFPGTWHPLHPLPPHPAYGLGPSNYPDHRPKEEKSFIMSDGSKCLVIMNNQVIIPKRSQYISLQDIKDITEFLLELPDTISEYHVKVLKAFARGEESSNFFKWKHSDSKTNEWRVLWSPENIINEMAAAQIPEGDITKLIDQIYMWLKKDDFKCYPADFLENLKTFSENCPSLKKIYMHFYNTKELGCSVSEYYWIIRSEYEHDCFAWGAEYVHKRIVIFQQVKDLCSSELSKKDMLESIENFYEDSLVQSEGEFFHRCLEKFWNFYDDFKKFVDKLPSEKGETAFALGLKIMQKRLIILRDVANLFPSAKSERVVEEIECSNLTQGASNDEFCDYCIKQFWPFYSDFQKIVDKLCPEGSKKSIALDSGNMQRRLGILKQIEGLFSSKDLEQEKDKRIKNIKCSDLAQGDCDDEFFVFINSLIKAEQSALCILSGVESFEFELRRSYRKSHVQFFLAISHDQELYHEFSQNLANYDSLMSFNVPEIAEKYENAPCFEQLTSLLDEIATIQLIPFGNEGEVFKKCVKDMIDIKDRMLLWNIHTREDIKELATDKRKISIEYMRVYRHVLEKVFFAVMVLGE